MLSPKLLEILRELVAGSETQSEWLFPGRYTGQPYHQGRRRAGLPEGASTSAAFPNRSHLIPYATPLPSIYWNPAPTSAPSNCCLVIAAWRPRPDICASPPARCAPPPVRSICSRTQSPLSRSPLRPALLSSGPWIARSLKWRMCSAATAKPIVSNMALRCPPRSAAS